MNKLSTHTKATFEAIPNGVIKILAKITSITEDNSSMSINERYPGHMKALAKAGLNMKNFPTFKELWENADER